MNKLYLIPFIMLLAACSSEAINSASDTANDNTNQRLKTADENIKTSANDSEVIVSSNIYFNSNINAVHISGSKQVNIDIDDSLIIIKLINDDRSYLDFKNANNYLNKSVPVGFNYTYGLDIESAVQLIRIFKKNESDQGLLFLPSYTEEYPSYIVLPFDNTGINHYYNIQIQSFNCDDFDSVTLNKATAKSISISQRGKSCKVEMHENKEIESLTIADDEDDKSYNEQPRALTSAKLVEMYSSDLYEFFNYDVNADGIKDKIITHKNDEKNFHQGSDLFVYLGDRSNRYKLSLKADNYTDETGWFLGGILPSTQ